MTVKNGDIRDSTENIKELGNQQTLNLKFKPTSLTVENASWSDQGWGNKKGRLFIRLFRNGSLIHTEDIFGICNRSNGQKNKSYGSNDQIVQKAEIGDNYKIFGRSGGGGGH